MYGNRVYASTALVTHVVDFDMIRGILSGGLL